ncbi:MAG: hypothetical protein U5R06_13025 [candidate division KSB1 bacterium]|nr:hypothetical protein [candidate division KSB1 bacterium]
MRDPVVPAGMTRFFYAPSDSRTCQIYSENVGRCNLLQLIKHQITAQRCGNHRHHLRNMLADSGSAANASRGFIDEQFEKSILFSRKEGEAHSQLANRCKPSFPIMALTLNFMLAFMLFIAYFDVKMYA